MNTIDNQSLPDTRKDIAGQTIKIGDYVVYGSVSKIHASGVLNFAKIVRLGTKKNPEANNIAVVSVNNDHFNKNWQLVNKGKILSINLWSNVLIINSDQIPNNAFQLLLCANASLKSVN